MTHGADTETRIVVLGVDEGYFDLAIEAAQSLRDCGALATCRLGVIDIGLREDQLERLSSFDPVVRRVDDVAYAMPATSDKHEAMRVARPHLPMYFPGYALLTWLDSDVWIQDAAALETLFAAAARHGFAIAPERHRAYRRNTRIALWRIRHLFQGAPFLAAADTARRIPVNAGVFSARAESPIWSAYAEALVTKYRRTGRLVPDQMTLEVALARHRDAFVLLDATCNWICTHRTPAWDPARRRFVVPDAPHDVIGILHLAGFSKSQPRRVSVLGDGAVDLTLRYARCAPLLCGERSPSAV